MPDRYSSREIFRILEEEILTLKIPPGESLSENELCERFGVSRSPIRSVLQELRLCDLVSITPYKRTQVTRMNFNIINQLIYQRIAVETFVLEDFIRIHNVLELERLRHIHNSMIELTKSDTFTASEFYALDSKLHETWFNATRKEFLWDTIQNANCHYTRFRMLDIVEIKDFDQILKDHEAIITAVETNDIKAIRPLMQKHLFGGITRLGKLLFSDLKDYFTED
ncbi:MAG TPA: GntR family transcriptional regulator [Candidatus Limiplasma sp.]|nr:GntR family transcriptional regulator [Candidatus Limiplasma sp.]